MIKFYVGTVDTMYYEWMYSETVKELMNENVNEINMIFLSFAQAM